MDGPKVGPTSMSLYSYLRSFSFLQRFILSPQLLFLSSFLSSVSFSPYSIRLSPLHLVSLSSPMFMQFSLHHHFLSPSTSLSLSLILSPSLMSLSPQTNLLNLMSLNLSPLVLSLSSFLSTQLHLLFIFQPSFSFWYSLARWVSTYHQTKEFEY